MQDNIEHIDERRGAHRISVGRPYGKIPIGRPRCSCENIIKMDLQAVGWGHGLNCSGS